MGQLGLILDRFNHYFSTEGNLSKYNDEPKMLDKKMWEQKMWEPTTLNILRIKYSQLTLKCLRPQIVVIEKYKIYNLVRQTKFDSG